jgi:hypothetical protein
MGTLRIGEMVDGSEGGRFSCGFAIGVTTCFGGGGTNAFPSISILPRAHPRAQPEHNGCALVGPAYQLPEDSVASQYTHGLRGKGMTSGKMSVCGLDGFAAVGALLSASTSSNFIFFATLAIL